MAKEDDLLPKKRAGAAKPSAVAGKTGVSPQMRKLMRIVRGIGIAFGGFVTLVAVMSVVGIVVENFWVRFLVGLAFVVALPAFLADRLLKRTNMGGGRGMVGDVFAILLLGVALVVVAAEGVTRPMLSKEGDRYARSGSTFFARIVYFLAAESPSFPSSAAPSGSASGSPSASSAPSASAR